MDLLTHSTPSVFQTRGIVLRVEDLLSLPNWPERAQRAGLTTIGTHMFPHDVLPFLQSQAGQRFMARCRALGIHVEHELHAMSDLLPRGLFARDPSLFPMDQDGRRVAGYNLCPSSPAALDIVCENAARYSRLLPSTSGRYFYWLDDGQPMCRCPQCRELSDSDQALLVENRILAAIRTVDARATLAHLVYVTTLEPPVQVAPQDGIFMEFAPITRLYDRPLGQRDAGVSGYPGHGQLLDYLDANLEHFARDTAQVLEYWLDESHFAEWKREQLRPLPWDDTLFADDVKTYAGRGIRHVTSFGVWLDAEYLARFGEPPLERYGSALLRAGVN